MTDTTRTRNLRWRLQLVSGVMFLFSGIAFAVVAVLSAVWGLGLRPLEIVATVILGAVGVVMIRAALRLRRSR